MAATVRASVEPSIARALPARSFRPHQPRFWSALATTMRPYLACVSATSGLVGLSLAGEMSDRTFWTALGAFFFVYGFGQAVTDVFQTDTDALSSPYRPLVRRIVRRRDVLAIGLLGLAGCAVALALANPQVLALAVLGVLGLLTYTPLKRRFWSGPLHNAWIVALLPAMGAMCGGGSLSRVLSTPRVLLAMASAFASYAVFVVLGYFKDIAADRATGYETLPVRLGRRAALAASASFGLLSLVPSAILVRPAFTFSWSVVGAPFWLSGVLLLFIAHTGMLGVERDEDAHPWITHSVRAFVLMRLGEALVAQPRLFHGAVAIVIIMEATLGMRPERTQV